MGDERSKAQIKRDNAEANKTIATLVDKIEKMEASGTEHADDNFKKLEAKLLASAEQMDENFKKLEAAQNTHSEDNFKKLEENFEKLQAAQNTHSDENFKKLETMLVSKFEELGKRVSSIEEEVKTKAETLEAVKNKVETLEKKESERTLDSNENRKRNLEFLDSKIAPLFLRQSIDKCSHELVVFNIGEIDHSLSDLEIGIKFLTDTLKLSKKDLVDHSPSHVQIRNRDTDAALIVVISF